MIWRQVINPLGTWKCPNICECLEKFIKFNNRAIKNEINLGSAGYIVRSRILDFSFATYKCLQQTQNYCNLHVVLYGYELLSLCLKKTQNKAIREYGVEEGYWGLRERKYAAAWYVLIINTLRAGDADLRF